MAEHIDLGSELAAYGGRGDDETPAYPDKYTNPAWLDRRHLSAPRTVPLADLEAGGFNTTPPPGYRMMSGFASGGPVLPSTTARAAMARQLERLNTLKWPEPYMPPTITGWTAVSKDDDDPS